MKRNHLFDFGVLVGGVLWGLAASLYLPVEKKVSRGRLYYAGRTGHHYLRNCPDCRETFNAPDSYWGLPRCIRCAENWKALTHLSGTNSVLYGFPGEKTYGTLLPIRGEGPWVEVQDNVTKDVCTVHQLNVSATRG